MTEHDLQERLVARWVTDGAVVQGERLFLAAWEVMTDYTVNDSRTRWNLPSVDFVLVDASGRVVVLEIKPAVRSPLQCWTVLCQVTHRAVVLADSYCHDLLERVHAEAWSGVHGRIPQGRVSDGLRASASRFFDDPGWELAGTPVRRMVAATSIGPRFGPICSTFVHDEPVARRTIAAYSDNKELRRYLALPSVRPDLVTQGVAHFEIEA